ncbi:MAG TPA: LysR family transcriptional regulator ArgP, partial [Hydrogenophaga sp.]|nr:LysR family transcriptional regulator ArgP [Hydrogenophaga sp.]
MLDYPSLFALAAVLREGSFERAARALHVTPSAVSQRIRLLEERVGCALVIRGQPCEATETGRRLCQHVDRLRLLEHELRSELPALLSDEQVWVNVPVAVNADSLATWFSKAMPDIAASAPGLLLQLSVDDEGHTREGLRSGSVLAAVTASEQPATGCSSRPLGAMRYVAAASPAFVARYFPRGINADCVRGAPSLSFNAKDELQQRWVSRLCGRHVEPPRHALPSPQGFVAAALAGMGWGLHPLPLVAEHLRSGQLVELVPDAPLDVPLHWQQARASSTLLEALTRAVSKAA